VRSTLALAILLAAGIGYLGYRVVTLEHKLDAVSAQLGAPARESKPAANTNAARPPAAQGHEQRLARLEHDVSSLTADVRSLEAATETTLNAPPNVAADPKQILSVVGSEVTRIRDRQLEFARANWLKWRREGIKQFAAQQKLSDQQSADMDDLMSGELDRVVALLRRQDLADKPEQFAAEAATVLRDTDNAARGVLTNEQFGPWTQMRANERHTLWPWLPE
jgi:hypothetical protein